ncbi:MAG TPA: malic enzyme-like NAD(P)-binding protein, partial [Fervidobacterium sp.]|nr:malic enzyme-like NAD(P)-binding protein [Fervidobacterium sp.]
AAGYNIVKLLIEFGAKHIVACDVHGILNSKTSLHEYHQEIASLTNPDDNEGTLSDALKDADLFIGVSKGNILSGDDVRKMSKNPIIFALANPLPEIDPNLAYENGAFIVATGRSDFPNQVNNLLAFPGIMKAAVEKQKKVTREMLIEAAITISKSVEPSREMIVPMATDRRAHISVYERLAHM